jgi:iron uptake system component EfeO
MFKHATVFVSIAVLAGCSGGTTMMTKTDAQYQQEIVTGMHERILTEIKAMKAAAVELQAAAPTPTGRGWDVTLDAAAIANMKAAWTKGRASYEHIEGAVAPLFPDLDVATDERYEGFLETLAPNGDQYMFDGQGCTGMHAVERILFSDVTPQVVIDAEKVKQGYKAAAYPATEAEAADFKAKLMAKLISDTSELESAWTPAKIDLPAAFQGLKDLMNEQREKVNLASAGFEESRYAQVTMTDMRNNLQGTQTIYALFRPWLLTRKSTKDAAHDGDSVDAKLKTAFDKLDAAYAAVTGEAIPAPPATWSAESPSATDLDSPFGKLYTTVKTATDPTQEASVVDEMNDASTLLGYPAE